AGLRDERPRRRRRERGRSPGRLERRARARGPGGSLAPQLLQGADPLDRRGGSRRRSDLGDGEARPAGAPAAPARPRRTAKKHLDFLVEGSDREHASETAARAAHREISEDETAALAEDR